MERELHVRQVDAHSLVTSVISIGNCLVLKVHTFKNLYLENFTQKNKKDLVIDEMTRHL